MSHPPASIIITNFNYGGFLRQSIDSALAQTMREVEVIVVDDGSTDDSRAILATYGNRIVSMLKPNGGQASAFNAGFGVSHGDVVVFLDADDVLLPQAVQTASETLAQTDACKVHWPLAVIDAAGQRNGKLHPATKLPEGDFRQTLIEQGPWMCETPPTSGNAWSRDLLSQVIPIPEPDFRICADTYLLTAAALLGQIRRIDEPQSCYRLHERNNYWNQPFEESLNRGMRMYELQCRTASKLLSRRGIEHNSDPWRRWSWWHRLHDATRDIHANVAPNESFALADDDQWGSPDLLHGRRRIPFPQVDSRYAGHPLDDRMALDQLRKLLDQRVRWFVLAWPCFWYLQHYPMLAGYLAEYANRVLTNERVAIYQFEERA